MKIHAQYDDGNGHPFDLRLEIQNIADITDAQAIDLAEHVFASDVVADAITALGYQDPFSVVFVEITDLIHYIDLS